MTAHNNNLRVVSLFSGAGGMDLGFKLEGGFDTVIANDILPSPAQTYGMNFGHKVIHINELNLNTNTPVYLLGDICKLNFDKIKVEDVDVVIGGPPCQDFSIVRGPGNERLGIKVKRGRLYAHFIRALIHLQPKVFTFENVPGLKSTNKGVAYETILNDISKLNIRWGEIKKIAGNNFHGNIKNYSIVFSDIVDVANLGVPQKRKRLIIIGVRSDLVNVNSAKFEKLKEKVQSMLTGTDSVFRTYPLTTIEVFHGKPLPELQNKYKKIMKDYQDIIKFVNTNRAEKWNQEVWKKSSFNIITDYLKFNGIYAKESKDLDRIFTLHEKKLKELGYYKKRLEGSNFPDKTNTVPKESPAVIERLKMIPPNENHIFVEGTRWKVSGRGLSLIYRRIHPLKPSYTVVAYGGGGTWGYHYRRDRGKLTNRERARLQTFPDNFLFNGNTTEIRAQIGEAVPPLLGKKIAEIAKIVLEACRTKVQV